MSDSRTPLRVLLIEDSENDAMLLLRELRRGGYEPLCQRVDTPEAMQAALRDADDREEPWEIIISDYYMPRFRGTDALAIVKRLGYDMPFIVVSGKVGEDLAVEIMKAGAQDYITKENMARLNPAIERELREAGVRRERLRTQEALDRSEERFRRLVEQAADAMFVHDLEGRFTDVNRQACESLGYTREELLALSVPDVEMDYESGALKKLWRQVSSGTHRTLEGVHRRKEGTTFPVEVRLGMFESEGTPLMLATARDVTDRKKAEDELRESEERFRALVQNASDIIIILGPDGTIRYESPALERILGYKPEERIGKKISDLIHPDDLEHVLQAFEAYVKDPGTYQTVEYRVRARDGSWHHFEGIGNNLIGDPSVRGLVVNARDITDRKRAEREIRESEEKYRTLFETMTQGIIYQDTEGTITSANPAAERMLGLSLDQMRNMTSRNLRWRTIREDGSDLPVEEYPISVALVTGERVAGVIGVFVPERDECRWINVTAVPQFRPGEDRPYQAYAIFDDVTDRKRGEEELQWSERNLSEAQRLAHLGN